MSKIQHLDNKLIDQIAAGEVIESPASVVKELIENAIDSKATFITINIIKGGHELIQVSDNGCGMNFNDIQMAFKRHATSKINSLKDLENITTLGFRGEALPSIASVSMFTAISCDNSGEAHKIIINGGIQESITPFASTKGTVCNVKNIFYNTPARRKFLKKPEKEQALINEIVRRIYAFTSQI
jgi:DNA mismatch repair enzyme (predicted ATPase)